ncbi:DUF1549 and DUF1553 domain-containing protein [Pirellulimonas nuda]|uniref:DUF1549 and DUF1553 domain-containing protein n=1 Tax=Pirellulimonas nuda TaxID=2528009 RepID=UPI0018D3FE26|nr:DUF1549 and DUF1553 domain-containing protein [Pirellulimonas nuda]
MRRDLVRAGSESRGRWRPAIASLLGLALFCAGPLLAADPAAPSATASDGQSGPLSYESDIRPILKAHCFYCHGEDETIEGGVDLRQVRRMIASHAIDEADPLGSSLLSMVQSGAMPLDGKPLEPHDVDLIRRWLAQGHRTARPEPEELPDFYITEEEQQHWAFQPVEARQPPAGLAEHPVDAFVQERLRTVGIAPAPPADRVTLIRRATLDLLGVPPTPEAVDRFLNDQQPGAWARAIDRLLDDPAYGPRWGRHWLDVVGYADSNGGLRDSPREHAWHYRDYVIDSYNSDKPFNEFLLEQIAGDELVGVDQTDAGKPIEDATRWDPLAATGFWAMPPDSSADSGVDAAVVREEALADRVRVVGTALLGMTVQCAQCHDHRFDPISHRDYFRLRALIDPVYNVQAWRKPDQRLIAAYTPEEIASNDVIEQRAIKVDQECEALIAREYAKYLEERMAPIKDERVKEQVRVAWNKSPDKRSEDEQRLLKEHDCDFRPSTHLRSVPGRKEQEAQRVALLEQAESIRATKLSRVFMAATEVPGQVPKTRRHHRGNPADPREEVLPGDLTVIRDRPKLPANDPELPTTGRRLAYARWLTSGKHPLVARVLVNRFWQHHFGAGLVAATDDFGMRTPRPAYGDLLDYLADRFVRDGWSLKEFHRLVMTSHVYQQSATNPAAEAIDAGNRLLARASLRRLEAEAVRDCVLAVSGQLDGALGGRPATVARDPRGGIVLGKELVNASNKVVHTVLPIDDAHRRSVYVQAIRERPLSVLAAFDMPTMTPNCTQRAVTTVAPQSLMMLNDRFVVDESDAAADRLIAEHDGSVPEQVRQLWRLAYGAPPTGPELEDAVVFVEALGRQQASVESERSPERRALSALCQVVFASNRFLYIP